MFSAGERWCRRRPTRAASTRRSLPAQDGAQRRLDPTALRVIGLFQPIMRELVEMHYLITEPVLMDDTALHRLLGTVRKTSYDEGIRLTFEAYKRA